MFDYIETFYNLKRMHARNGIPSSAPVNRKQMMRGEGF